MKRLVSIIVTMLIVAATAHPTPAPPLRCEGSETEKALRWEGSEAESADDYNPQNPSDPNGNQQDVDISVTTDISDAERLNNGEERIKDNPDEVYDLSGRRMTKPAKGLNVVRQSDGRVRKVVRN